MPIPVICPNGHELNVPDQYLGKSIRCPKCTAPILVEWPIELDLATDGDGFDPFSASAVDPLLVPTANVLAGQATTYAPAPVRTSPKPTTEPHWLETTAGKATSVGGGIALGSLLALMLLGVISFFRGGSSSADGSLANNTDTTQAGPVDPNAPDPTAPLVREAVGKMREVMLSIINYEDAKKRFPGGSSKVSGLSWRVHVLPFLKQQELFDQFKLDEPWDSPANLPLAAKMPDVFRIGKGDESKTRFQVIRGPDLIFGLDQPQRLSALTDGVQNTVLTVLVGADKAVTWTQPDDFDFNAEKPIESLGKMDNNVIVLASCTQVIGLGMQVDPKDFLALVTPKGGEVSDPIALMERTLGMTVNEFTSGKKRIVAPPPGSGDQSALASRGSGKLDAHDQVQIAAFGMLAHQQLFQAYTQAASKRPGGQLGWRVHILPLIGEAELYRQFNLNEPWNGPTNSKLLAKIPNCFNTGDGPKTRIRSTASLVGPSGKLRPQNIPDSGESTLLTLYVPKSMATEWTKPEDLDVSPQLASKILAELKNELIIGVTCVGQPIKLLPKVAGQHLLGLLTINGGEKIDIEQLIGSEQLAVPVNQKLIAPISQQLNETGEQSSRIKQLVLGMQNYSDTYKGLPPAKNTLSPEGQERLSWRVHILPFIEQKNLYDKFKLDEPWDSPHNLTLLDKMPSVFAEPGAAPSSDTTIIKVQGPGTVYTTAVGPRTHQVKDGGLTVLLYKTGPENKVPWTKPDVLQVDLENVQSALATQRKGFFYCAMVDGRVSTIKTSLPAEQLKAIFSASGQEALPEWMGDYGGNW